MHPEITKVYGDRVRLRVCGLCWQDRELLLVNHAGLRDGDFWAPPGGGVELGSGIEENLSREFVEETGFRVKVERFMFGCEFIQKPLHSVELFFRVSILDGNLTQGLDPELQIIQGVRFCTPDEIRSMNADELHGIFKLASTPEEFEKLRGFYRI